MNEVLTLENMVGLYPRVFERPEVNVLILRST